MESSLRFLLCTAWVPWGEQSGFQQRITTVIEVLRRMGAVDVCLLNSHRPGELDHLSPAWVSDLRWLQVTDQPAWAARVTLGAQASVVRHAHLTSAGTDEARRLFATPYDLVWCVEPRAYEPIAAHTTGPVAVDLYDLLSVGVAHKRRVLLRDLRAAQQVKGVTHQPAYLPGISRRWRQWETAVGDRCDRVIVCSEVEHAQLGGNAAVVPNTYPRPASPAGRRGPADQRPLRIGFVGQIHYQPNYDAVRWFATKVLPRIHAEEPDARFHVIGRNGPALLGGIRYRRGVRILGYVEDLAAQLSELSVVVAPLRFGGGTRVKLLEAFAHELPVVSTRMGAEGLDVQDGEQLLLRDDADGMARAIVELYRDPDRQQRLVGSARALYESRYTWEHGLAAVEREVAGLIRQPRLQAL